MTSLKSQFIIWVTEKKKFIQQETDRISPRRCPIRTAVLENDAKFTKNACVGVSFLIKLQDEDLQLYSKRDSTTDLFVKIMQNFL